MELIKLKKVINWTGINKIYKSCFNSKKGNKTKTTDIALGLLLLKHLYKKSDRALISELHLNNSYMYFCSPSYDEVAEANKTGKKLMDHSTLVKIRKRLGAEKIQNILSLFTEELVKNKIIDGKYLFTDTTTLEKNIAYPTDVSLLSRVIKEADCVIQNVKRKKDAVISAAVKKAKTLSKIYYSSSKKTKDLLNKTAKSLVSIAKRQVHVAGVAIAHMAGAISRTNIKRYEKLKEVGKKIVKQVEKRIKGAKVPGRIVSYYEELYNKRSAIEAKISEAKRMYGLNKSYYKGFEGDKMWASLSIMALNIRKLLRDITKSLDLIYRFAQ